MRIIGIVLTRLGDYIAGLSNRARLQLVIIAIVLLGGAGLIKLVRGIQSLNEPAKPAIPEEFIEPMQELFVSSGARSKAFSDGQRKNKVKLDSLSKIYPDLKSQTP